MCVFVCMCVRVERVCRTTTTLPNTARSLVIEGKQRPNFVYYKFPSVSLLPYFQLVSRGARVKKQGVERREAREEHGERVLALEEEKEEEWEEGRAK